MKFLKIDWGSVFRGTNFYFNLVMFIGAFWGLQQETGTAIISAGVALVAVAGMIRQFVSTAKFGGVLPTLLQKNTQNYLAQLLIPIVGPLAETIIKSLGDIGDGVTTQNWGLAFSAFLTLANILLNLLKKNSGSAS